MSRKVLDLSLPIMVTMESFKHLNDAKLVSNDGSIFECTLINCDQISRNNTYYPFQDMLSSMQDRRVQEKLDQKCFFGEAEHPASDTEEPLPLKRLMRIEPSRISHRIDNYWADGTDIKGLVQWAGPFGQMYRELLVDHGSNLAMSVRAYTPNFIQKNEGGRGYVVKKHPMFIASYDCVTLPGLEDARIMKPSEFKAIAGKTKISTSASIRTSESLTEIVYKDTLSEIKDLMRSEEGVDIVGDMFGIDLKNVKMGITGKNTLTVFSNEGVRLDLPMSRTILSEIL